MNFLVLCTYNNFESIAFESIMNHRAMDRVTVYSAGPEPAAKLPEKLVDVIMAMGHDLRDLKPKHWNGFVAPDAPALDLVLTLCPEVEGFTAPKWPDDPVKADWSHLIPIRVTADGPVTTLDLRNMISELTNRADELLSLPLETISRNGLAAEVTRIGARS